jgi:predicted ArsR family transcriptional regulator
MSGTTSSETLDRHIDELCSEHCIERETGGRSGRAFQRGRGRTRTLHIRIAPVKGQVTYFVALHEIGHLVGKGRSATRLEKEAAAWRWAIEHSLVTPTDAARRGMGRRLRSYVQWAELRQHRRRPPVIPPPSSSFWDLLAALES